MAHGAITISSNNNGGGGRQILTSTGALLTGGSVRIGYFANIGASDSVMRGGDWAALNALFIPLGESAANPTRGDVTTPATAGDLPIPVPSGASPGRYSGQITGITSAGLPLGTRLFILVSNSSNPAVGAPSEWALVSEAAWVAPFDDPFTGGSATLALNATNIDSVANDVWRGNISTTGASANFLTLAVAVPEPTSLVICAFLSVGLLRRRR